MADENNKVETNFNQELRDALDRCSENLSFEDISRLNGIRLELIRRYIDRQARNLRKESWDKIYPMLKPLLEGPEPVKEPPPRIGAPYRRHAELVEMVSDQKVLLDVYNVLSPAKQQAVLKAWEAKVSSRPTAFTSLSADENKLMGSFLAMAPEVRETELLALIRDAREEIASRR